VLIFLFTLILRFSFLFFSMMIYVFFLMFFAPFSNCVFVELEPEANEGKKKKTGSKTQTNGEKDVWNGGPLPARRPPPRLRELARRAAALASAPRRRRDTTALTADCRITICCGV
jgi:hypothetical protein